MFAMAEVEPKENKTPKKIEIPWKNGELEPGKLIRETITDESTRARLLNGTALEWLGLDASRFAKWN